MNAAVRTGSGITFGRHALPKPPGVGQVTIRVRAASINPVDYKVGKFLLGPIAGLDVAGVVEQVGDGVDAFKPGDAVFGFTSGSCCELTVADAAKLALVPPGVDFTNAAALPTAYLTSYQSLLEHGKLRTGGKVLIIGASGGCGLAACQLARAVGASEIVAVCSAANAPLVESQGATRVVAYDGDDDVGVTRRGCQVRRRLRRRHGEWRGGGLREPVSRDGLARGSTRRHQRRRVEVDSRVDRMATRRRRAHTHQTKRRGAHEDRRDVGGKTGARD